MRILHVLTAADADGSYGGPLSVALSQASGLRARGHEVDIVSTYPRAANPRHELGLHSYQSVTLSRRLPFSTRVSAPLWRRLHTDMRSYDVVHVHAARDLIPLVALGIARRRDIPAVAQPHGMWTADIRRSTRLVDKAGALRLLRSARRVVALNAWESKQLTSTGVDGELIRVVPNAGPAVRPRQAAADIGRLVIFISRLHPRKRVIDFVDMAALLIAEGVVPVDARFEIYGPDAGDLPLLTQHLLSLPRAIQDRVKYRGALTPAEVETVLNRAHVFVLPSRDEPFPIAVLEAMAAGVPTVVTDTCHISELITAHGAGLVTTSDVRHLAAAVRRLLMEPDVVAAVSAGATRMLDELSLDRVSSDLESVYQEAVFRP